MESFTALSHRAQVGRLKRLAAAALAEYDLLQPRLAPLVHAFNTTFQVTDAAGNRYALRIARPGKCSVAEVQSELAWLLALHRDTDLVVPDPVPTRVGALLTKVSMLTTSYAAFELLICLKQPLRCREH